MTAAAIDSQAAAADSQAAAVDSGPAVPAAGQVWTWLGEVADPEIPVVSIVDLGIVRDVRVAHDGVCDVTITPTYSGCPAMLVIADAVTSTLHAHGVRTVRLHSQLSPAWTTDWMSAEGKARLIAYGIAPPARQVIDISALRGGARGAAGATDSAGSAHLAVSRRTTAGPAITCPRCGSIHTELSTQFGSTPCKALYRCLDCREPFDYFKPH